MLLGGIYAAKSRGASRFRSERTERIPNSPFVPKAAVEIGYWLATGLGRGIARLGITANHCTALSLLLGIVAAWCIAVGHLIWGGAILFAGASLDTLDGIIARATGTASDAGEFFDATVDRVNDAAALLGILYYYQGDALGFVLGCIALVGSLLVSYVRAKGEALGVDCAVGWMQRHERIIWLVLGLVFGPLAADRLEPGVETPRCHVLLVALGVIGAFSLATAVQRSRIVYRSLAKRRSPAP
jgi:CDP-diacylglycerol--glycerol-3-phosphate 3-phosphatidyltransferase